MRRGLCVLVMTGVLAMLAGPAAAQDGPTSETFVSSSGRLTFEHPTGWGIYESVPGRADFLAYMHLLIVDEGGYEQVFSAEGYVLNASNTGPAPSVGPRLADSVTGVLGAIIAEDIAPFGDTQRLTLGSQDVAYVCTCDDPDFLPLLYVISVALGSSNYLVMHVQTAPGVRDAFEEQFFAMLATMRFEPITAIQVALPAPTGGDAPVRWAITDLPYPVFAVAAGADDTLYAAGEVYVDDFGSVMGGVMVLDARGVVQRALANPDLTRRADIAVAQDGTLWITDFHDCELHHLAADGVLLASVRAGTGDACPQQIEIDSAGALYTLNTATGAAWHRAGIVQVHSPEGERLREFGVDEPGRFEFDTEVGSTASFSIGPDDRLYITTNLPLDANSSARVFDTDGALVVDEFAPSTSGEAPRYLYAAPDGLVYVVPSEGGVVTRYTPEGERRASFDVPVQTGWFDVMQAMVMVSDGSLVITNLDSLVRVMVK